MRLNKIFLNFVKISMLYYNYIVIILIFFFNTLDPRRSNKSNLISS